jgi:hypothetical protein
MNEDDRSGKVHAQRCTGHDDCRRYERERSTPRARVRHRFLGVCTGMAHERCRAELAAQLREVDTDERTLPCRCQRDEVPPAPDWISQAAPR